MVRVLGLQGRIKSLYSIQRKMRRKGVSLEEVYDARALRVVVDDADGEQQASVDMMLPLAQ
jgi:(p)ppGpp synthase/HD superfamily hydrolase